MQLVPLRARATCNLCESKLPPRTEAWWDEATRQATCLTCELLLRAERGEMAPTPEPAPEPAPAAAAPPAPPAPAASPAPPPAPAPPPVLDTPAPPAPTPPLAAKPAPRATPSIHQPPQLPRLVEVSAPRVPAPPAPPPPAVEPVPAPEPPLARQRRRAADRPVRGAPEPPRSDLPARDLPAVPPLPPRDAGPVPPVDARPDPPAPAAPRLTEVPEPAAARVPEPADPPRSDPGPEVEPEPAPAVVDDPAAARVPEPAAAAPVDDPEPEAEPEPDPEPEPEPEAAEPEVVGAPEEPSLPAPASLHHDFDPASAVHVIDVADGGDGGDLFAPAPIAVPVPNGDRPVDLMAPPRPSPGASAHLVPADLLDRGDMGEGRVGQTLEGARVHGLEVVHGLRIEAHLQPIDHLVVAVNGLWVVDAVDVLAGKLERRDEGDWFTADPRLHIDGEDRTELVASVRGKVEAVTRLLARTDFTDIPVRGVLCFGTVQPGWITEPFVLDGVAITWRRKLVEPMLDPVLIDQNSRSALLNLLVSARVEPRPMAPLPVVDEREVG